MCKTKTLESWCRRERAEKQGKSLKKVGPLAEGWNGKITIHSVVHPFKDKKSTLQEHLNDVETPSFCIIISPANTGLLVACTTAQQAWQTARKWNVLCFIVLRQIRKNPQTGFLKKQAVIWHRLGEPQPPLRVNWHWLAFPGTRQGRSLASSDAAAPSRPFLRPLWNFSLPRRYEKSLPACSQENCHNSSCNSCLSIWKSFSLAPLSVKCQEGAQLFSTALLISLEKLREATSGLLSFSVGEEEPL